MANNYAFSPDYIIPPGDTLKETLEVKGMSQTDLATRTGMADKTVSQIINGIAAISYEIAEKLELATGVPASFWNRRELSYREAIVRKETSQKLQANIDWLKELPVKEIVSRGYVERVSDGSEMVRRMLKFFGVSSVDAWRNTWGLPSVQFRGKKAMDKYPGFVAAWLRIGEMQAESIETEPFDAREFNRSLWEVRKLSLEKASVWNQRVPVLCSAAGVAIVFTREIPNAGISGATRWLTKDKALLQLSLKYKTDDHLWFTMFHEAGHILLHGKKQLFLEFGISNETEEEKEANEFSRDMLIPRKYAHRLPYLKTKAMISSFAKSIGVSPGIVVGRMQYEKLILPSYHNGLKKKLTWGD